MIDAFIDAQTAITVELPTGKKVECKSPPIKEAVAMLKLLGQADMGDMTALGEICERFPALVGLEPEAFNGLTPMELSLVATRFFTSVRLTGEAKKRAEAATAGG